jgi:hypothetical protein
MWREPNRGPTKCEADAGRTNGPIRPTAILVLVRYMIMRPRHEVASRNAPMLEDIEKLRIDHSWQTIARSLVSASLLLGAAIL